MNEKNKNNTASGDLEEQLSIGDLDQIDGGSPGYNPRHRQCGPGRGHTASPAINAYLGN